MFVQQQLHASRLPFFLLVRDAGFASDWLPLALCLALECHVMQHEYETSATAQELKMM